MQFNKITLKFLTDDYERIAYTLPIPTYRSYITKYQHQGYIIITYELIHTIKTHKQFLWLGNIKHSIKHYVKYEFDYVEYIKRENAEYSQNKFNLDELSKYFNPIKDKYPKIYYAGNKQEFYKKLVWYAKRLYYYDYLYIEMLMYASIKMNKVLNTPFNDKELISKSMRAYDFIKRNEENLKQKLTDFERSKAFSNAGKKRGQQMTNKKEENKQKIKELIKDSKYIKSNNKIKISLLADDIGLSRQTVSNLLKELLFSIYPLFLIHINYLFSNGLYVVNIP